MNKKRFLTICTVVASLVFTVTTNAQVVVYSNNFEDGDTLGDIGSENLGEGSALASVVPVAGGPDEMLGENVLLLDQDMIDLDLALNLEDTLSLTGGNTVTFDFDYAARREDDASATIFVESLNSDGNIVVRFILGDLNAFGNGQNDRQRPGFSTLVDGDMPFGTPPGAFWWGADTTPDDFDAGQLAHISLTIRASTFDFFTTSQAGVEFSATGLSNFDGTSTDIAEIRVTSFGSAHGGYFDNTRIAGVVADGTVVLGDVNQSGTVDFSDISPFIALLSSGEFQAEADINMSGSVDFSDISPFIAILSGS